MKLVLMWRPGQNRGSETLELTYVGHLWGFNSPPYSFVYVLGLPVAVVLCQAMAGCGRPCQIEAGQGRLWQTVAGCGRLCAFLPFYNEYPEVLKVHWGPISGKWQDWFLISGLKLGWVRVCQFRSSSKIFQLLHLPSPQFVGHSISMVECIMLTEVLL